MTVTANQDILRDLDICRADVQRERRDLWRKHNSLVRTRPLIIVREVTGS